MNITSFIPNLIVTKLLRPPAPSYMLLRPRLVERLDASLNTPLTLVCAPAGFGKTTLISSWVEGVIEERNEGVESLKFAWVSLDQADSNLALFLHYFVAAIRSAVPDACASVQDLLVSGVPVHSELIPALCNDLSLLPSRLILVLDEYNLIHGNSVHELLNDLIRHMPPTIRLILISRNSPPLSLANLRAKGKLTEIRIHDLRFTAEESAKFLAEMLPVSISTESLAVLQQRTDGWIVGLHLAVLSLSEVADIESAVMHLAGSDSFIADYLVDEVLSQQPLEIQKFLLITSILERFCVELCEIVFGDDKRQYDIRASMDWAERNNLFVVRIDNDKVWFRYHSLFRELLQYRLRAEVSPETLNGMYRRTAIWCAQNGLMDEALGYALTSHNFELAAQLIEQGMCDVLNNEDRPTLERWLNLLPDEVVQRHPGLLMIKAWVFQLAWQVDAQLKVLQQAEALIDEADEGTFSIDEMHILRGQIATMYGQAAYLRNEPDLAVALCQEALACLPDEWLYVRGGALIYLGRGMQAIGRGRDAVRLLLESYESITDRATSYALRHLMILCDIYARDGQLEQVREIAQLMLPPATQARLTIQETWAHYFLGVVSYEQNDLKAAREHFEAVVKIRDITQVRLAEESFFGLVLVQQAWGEWEEARERLEEFRQFTLKTTLNENDRIRSLHARLLLQQGDLESASRWADAFVAPPSQEQPLLWLETPHLTKARILLARGNDEDVVVALEIIDMLYEIACRTFNINFQMSILSLRALALDTVGGTKADDAFATLREVLELARQGGYIRVFVDLGLPMKDMLVRLVRRGFVNETIRRIIEAFPDGQISARVYSVKAEYDTPALAMYEHLTARELDVLMLLSKRSSNKEIASELSISTVTVKRHVANIYGKLGVNRRWDAVIKAETMGLISPQ